MLFSKGFFLLKLGTARSYSRQKILKKVKSLKKLLSFVKIKR